MSMNAFLAQFYGTNEPTEKTAAAEPGELSHEEKVDMFAKLAEDNGIDLSQLSDEKIESLFTQTFAKEAGGMPPQFMKKEEGGGEKKPDDKKKDEEEEKKAAAERELQEKKAAQQQFDHADFMGRIMAHAYVNEMRKIASDVEAKTASAAAPAEKAPEVKTASLLDRLLKMAGDDKPEEKKKDEKKDGGDDKGKSVPPWMKDKEASAIDELACEQAVRLVQEYNKTAERQFDVKVAAERIAAIHVLGPQESTKLASAANLEAATHIRALEFLEAAGYPVTWQDAK